MGQRLTQRRLPLRPAFRDAAPVTLAVAAFGAGGREAVRCGAGFAGGTVRAAVRA